MPCGPVPRCRRGEQRARFRTARAVGKVFGILRPREIRASAGVGTVNWKPLQVAAGTAAVGAAKLASAKAGGSVKDIKKITKRIDLIHANGSRDEFDSSRDRHANFEDSLLPKDLIGKVVKEAKCNVIIETSDQGIENDIKYLKKMVS